MSFNKVQKKILKKTYCLLEEAWRGATWVQRLQPHKRSHEKYYRTKGTLANFALYLPLVFNDCGYGYAVVFLHSY